MENNKQQTPVEWFFNQLVQHGIIVINASTYSVKTKHEILLEQAKEMEELRIIKILAEQSTKEASSKSTKSMMYLVYYSTGSYDTAFDNYVFVTESEEFAINYVNKFNDRLFYWKKYWKDLLDCNNEDLMEMIDKHYNRYSQILDTYTAYYKAIEKR